MDSKRQGQYIPVEIHNARQQSTTLYLEPGETLLLVVGGPKRKSLVQVYYGEDAIEAYFWSLTELWVYRNGEKVFTFPDDTELEPPAYLDVPGQTV